jgi:NAD(P)-dependent dehydrogenase (short-subunit alcohol dehydrogenase family)
MNVVAADIDLAAAEETASLIGAKAIAVRVDVGDRESVLALERAARDAFGAVHVLCNNAGVVKWGTAQTLKPEDWDWVLNVNLNGVINGIMAFVPGMVAQGDGHIVNTGSNAGLAPNVVPGLISYTASKYAVVGLTESLRADLKGTGVSASVLCPGGVWTNIMRAEEHRQERFGGPVATEWRSVPDGGGAAAMLDPAAVAAIVFEGIRTDELYILSHPETRREVEHRHGRISAAYDRAEARDAGGSA